MLYVEAKHGVKEELVLRKNESNYMHFVYVGNGIWAPGPTFENGEYYGIGDENNIANVVLSPSEYERALQGRTVKTVILPNGWVVVPFNYYMQNAETVPIY